jgi:hypothetical protein
MAATRNKLTGTELRGEQIFDVLKELRLACCAVASRSCSYIDVFSADQVPSLNKLCSFTGATGRGRPCCYKFRSFIANTDPSTAPGYHWVAFVVFADRPSVIYFFDSFGMPLTAYDDLYRTCMSKGYFSDTRIVCSVNSRSLQGATSTVCGHYCILFLYLCARLSLETSRSRISAQHGFALSAVRVLTQITGGYAVAANDRDVAVVRVLNELRKRWYGRRTSSMLSPTKLG